MLFRTPFFLPWLYPNLTWRIPSTEKVIYLTFDDGPMPGPTDFVLDQLARRKAQATFFCIGDNVRKHPGTACRIAEQGHAVGNHTFHHLKGWNYTAPEYLNNIALCENQLLETFGPRGGGRSLFRPPHGRIKRNQIAGLGSYRIIMWDVLTLDYDTQISVDRSLTGSIRASRPGSIVVFHDSLKAEGKMTRILPAYLDHFAGLGYTFKTLPNS